LEDALLEVKQPRRDAALAALHALRAQQAEQASLIRKHDRETTSIHADMLKLAALVDVHYDGVSSPAGFLHALIMPALQSLRTQHTEQQRTFGLIYQATGSDLDGSTPEHWAATAADPAKYAYEAVQDLRSELEAADIEYEARHTKDQERIGAGKGSR